MRHVMINRPDSSKEPEPSKHAHAGPPQPRPAAPTLSHRQAREQLALLLDETTDYTLRAALQQHVARCSECCRELRQLRQAEAWFQAQPREVPEMVALEGTTWAAMQERLNPRPQRAWDALQALLGEQQLVPAEPQPAPRPLLLVGAASDEHEQLPPLQPPAPGSPASAPVSLPSPAPTWMFRPQKVLVAVLAASFLMTSMAALFLAHLSRQPAVPASTIKTLPSLFADMLDPGVITTALSFDPLSHRLFTLSSDQRFDCPRGAHCPDFPACLRASSLDVETDRRLDVLAPACVKQQAKGSASFTALFDDAALGQVLAVSSDQQVMTYSSRAAAPGATYALACCSDQDGQIAKTFLDQRDHLLLTAAISGGGGGWETLAAQDTRTGKLAYQTALPAAPVGGWGQGALLSEVTGWLYLWADCTTFASGVCLEAFEAKSGKQVATLEALADETPLLADPAQAVLYVRHDENNGQSETLALDATTGALRGTLPAAGALAVNAKLHHAYALSQAGVTAVDTQSWQVLSTLPVLASDRGWTPPAVDAQRNRVYVPTILGKVLKVQDDQAGRLSISSPEEEAVLNADRVMENGLFQGKNALDPWQLPLGPGVASLYYDVKQTTSDGWAMYGVPARLQTTVSQLAGRNYSVLIALAWSHASAADSAASTPPLFSSYPYTHTWRYQVPAAGDAVLSEEQGDALARCC